MSERERWVVYPLLFLALGVAMRDKMTRSVEGLMFIGGKSLAMNLDDGLIRARELNVDLVRCKSLRVEEETSRPLVVVGGVGVRTRDGQSRSSGAISLHGQNGKEIIVLRANHALKGEFIKKQKEGDQVEIVFQVQEVTEDGGLLEVFDGDKTLSLVLAHHASQSGLFAKNAKGQLGRLSRVVTRRAPPAADPEEPPAAVPADDGSTGNAPEAETEVDPDSGERRASAR